MDAGEVPTVVVVVAVAAIVVAVGYRTVGLIPVHLYADDDVNAMDDDANEMNDDASVYDACDVSCAFCAFYVCYAFHEPRCASLYFSN